MSGASPAPSDADLDPEGLGPALTWRPLPINAARGGLSDEQLVLSNSDLVSLIVLNVSGDVNEFQRMKRVNKVRFFFLITAGGGETSLYPAHLPPCKAFARGIRRFLASRNSMPVWERSMRRFQGEVLAVNDGNFRML